jgi:membrane-associated protease RseP (regulator of RpoE activity)
MPTLVDCPQGNLGEWRFQLFGVPVCVKLWFWAACLITCMGRADDTGAILIWVAVCFASILVHEMGHVCAFRMFGAQSEVVLYGFGGLTIPYRGVRGMAARLMVPLAGPAAGFCATGLVVAAALSSGARVHLGWRLFLPSLGAFPATVPVAPGMSTYLWYVLLNDLLFVNFFWGLVNLLPIYPLDGGQASRALFEQADPSRGRRKSLILSVAAAVAIALAGAMARSGYVVLMFAILAVASLQALEGEGRYR